MTILRRRAYIWDDSWLAEGKKAAILALARDHGAALTIFESTVPVNNSLMTEERIAL
jgi:hypothetical protein